MTRAHAAIDQTHCVAPVIQASSARAIHGTPAPASLRSACLKHSCRSCVADVAHHTDCSSRLPENTLHLAPEPQLIQGHVGRSDRRERSRQHSDLTKKDLTAAP